MKFRDGMWLVAQDKRVEYAEDIFSVTESEEKSSLKLLCPSRKVYSRGDTLNTSTLTIDIEAVSEGVISVEVVHWDGALRRGPNFELFPDGHTKPEAFINRSEQGTSLKCGSISATVSPDPKNFSIKFNDNNTGKELTSLLNRSVGLAYTPSFINPKTTEDMRGLKHYIFTQTELGVGESIHGLGERFGGFNKVGQSIEIFNDDGGTSSDQAYKNISFWLSSRGYGVFIDTPEKIELEIGSERCCRLQTSVEAQRLKWYIINGPTPKDVLSRYTVVTGRANKVPAWSFGLWLTTSFTTEYDEKTVTHFLEGMKERQIPLEVFHFDCFWMKAFQWCDFVFSPEHFPDPAGQISRMKESKLIHKVCVWINPYLGQASPVFRYAADKGYLVKRESDDVWQWDLWQAGMGLIDFTNPEACEWYTGCLKKLFEMGVENLKTDFAERIPVKGIKWYDPTVDPNRMHNFYAFLYNKIVYQAVQKFWGNDQAVLFARAAAAGSQRFPLHWGGDCESTPAAIWESLKGGLSLGLCGFSFWSVDIGGFEGNPPPWIYKRWVAFGLLCSHSRLHGSNSYRVPWLVDNDSSDAESCTAVCRTFVKLKRRLMPYIYAQAKMAWENGWPLSLRAMCMEFPEDPTAWTCDRQFMFGSQLLVAPVFAEDGEVQFYLPEGTWTSLWDQGKTVTGPKWVTETHGFLTLPVYVREGTVLVTAEDEEAPGQSFEFDWLAKGKVTAYKASAGASVELVDKAGNSKGSLTVKGDKSLDGISTLGDSWAVEFTD